MNDPFTATMVVVLIVWLAITVAFGVVIAKMIRVNEARNAAGSGVPKPLEHRADPSSPHAMTTSRRYTAADQHPQQE
jgi:hypothetical protein